MSGPGFSRMKRRLGVAAAEDLRLSVMTDRTAALEGVGVEKRRRRAALTAVSVARYKPDPGGKRLRSPTLQRPACISSSNLPVRKLGAAVPGDRRQACEVDARPGGLVRCARWEAG